MKVDYIRVKSISEIDPEKIPLASLHLHRYIDSDNNRFALRFNKETHKVEIHRILNKSELESFKHIPDVSSQPAHADPVFEKKKKAEKESEGQLISENSDLNIFETDDRNSQEVPREDNREHIETELEKLEEIKNRITHIINNLNGSRIYESSSDDRTIISDLSREMDVEVYQEIERVQKYYRELTLYPRPISYYTTKYEKTRPGILKKISSSEEQTDRLIKWEMEALFDALLEQIKTRVMHLLEKINIKTEEQIIRLAYNNQQVFRDAKNAAILCYNEITAMIGVNNKWIKMDE